MPSHPANNPLLNPPVLSQSSYNPANHPPSPATTAAAMSLGALAAAASMAAPATTPSSPLQPPPPLPPQYLHSSYPSQNPTSFVPQHSHRQSIPSHPHDPPTSSQPQHSQSQQSHPPYASSHLHSNPSMVPAPAMSQLARPKPSPTPVAPAPTNMHPSQQHPTHPNGKPKQRRYRATPEQLRHLIGQFEQNPSPSSGELQELAAKIGMPAQSAVLWFKNRRARVPHKKTEKALAAKRREDTDLPVPTDTPNHSPEEDKPAAQPTTEQPTTEQPTTEQPLARPTSVSAEVVAAASMAEMAMHAATEDPPRKAGRNITNQDKPPDMIPSRSPSGSPPPPLYRNRAVDAVPFDVGLAARLSSNTKNGAEFGTPSTLRRPRVLPRTPRLFSQREYEIGEPVEVLETSKGICRSWYSGTIVGQSGLKDLSLGESAATVTGHLPHLPRSAGSTVKDGPKGENSMTEDGQDDGGDSPRTVRSPLASPTPPMAKITYLVEYNHRFEDSDSSRKMREEVLASRIRPASPYIFGADNWRPDAGEAVEVLRDGAWFVAVTQTFAVRKGYMVSFESGDVQWVRRPGLRPYQIWKGGDMWVTKKKPPLPVVRKSVGLSVTHPPGGKRKRRSLDSGSGAGNGGTPELRETRGRSKRAKSMVVDGSGPDGLPEGWRRMEYHAHMKKSGIGGRGQMYYVAPDGNRLRSLKEAQRYVKIMGPG